MLAAIDLDGTLLSDDKTIPEEVCHYLKNDWTGKLAFVTGRDRKDTYYVIDILSKYVNEFFVIYEDGQYVLSIDNGNLTVLKTFPYLADKILENVQKWCKKNNINYIASSNGKWYSIRNDKSLLRSILYRIRSRKNSNETLFKSIDLLKGEKISKLSFSVCESDSLKILDELSAVLGENAYSVYNDGKIEIKASGASKLESLIWLLDYCSINENKCVYFGNDGNDVECLKHFRYSYAVNNARIEVKKAAKKVTKKSNGFGVIEGLKEIGGY